MSKDEEYVNNFYSTEYEEFNYLYADHIKFSKKLFEQVESIFKEHKVRSVIDCCCGVGNDLIYFADKGYYISGTDLSSEMVAKTKKSIASKGFYIDTVFQSDILSINKKVKIEYDLAIFRGNTLGHLNSKEQAQAIDNLFKISKTNGLIFIDFRDGIAYNKSKKLEQRGYGINNERKEIFYSYYVIKHSKTISKEYLINSKIFIFDIKRFRLKIINRKINGNYVIPDNILECIKNNNGEILYNKKDTKGLQKLQTLIIRKL